MKLITETKIDDPRITKDAALLLGGWFVQEEHYNTAMSRVLQLKDELKEVRKQRQEAVDLATEMAELCDPPLDLVERLMAITDKIENEEIREK